MFIGLGTVINVLCIIAGSSLGLLAGAKFKEKTRDLITTVLGFVTLLVAADSIKALWDSRLVSELPTGGALLTVLAALLLGALVGSRLRIEDRLESFGVRLKNRFDANGSAPFVDGFVSASLLFVIGPMAILGSISDGMRSGITQLVLKSILDGITSIAFAATLGWGVAVSALPVGIYQFAWTGIGFALGAILTSYQVLAITATGGILLLGIALRLLKIKIVPVADLLPALFFAPLIAALVHLFH